MLVEALAALLLGGLVLWLVLEPLYGHGTTGPAFVEPEDPEETRRGIALIALKEIDFDRATGKLSEADYEFLKRKYTLEALAALREEEEDAATDQRPGAEEPSPDPAAAETPQGTTPSLPLPAASESPSSARPSGPLVCPRCGPRSEPEARFCSRCGAALHAVNRCQVCRAELAAKSRFCAACGSRVAA